MRQLDTLIISIIQTHILTILVKFPISGGIGPDSMFPPKSNTLRNFNAPSSLGIVPMKLLPCIILQILQSQF